MTFKGIVNTAIAYLIVSGIVAVVGAIIVGLYFLEHYRWGCSP